MPEAPDQPFADAAPLDGLIGEPTGGPDDEWQGELFSEWAGSGLTLYEWNLQLAEAGR